MKSKNSTQNLLVKIYKDPRFKGKHVIVINNKLYATNTGKEKTLLLDKLLKKYPKSTPTITYIPKVDTLVLIQS